MTYIKGAPSLNEAELREYIAMRMQGEKLDIEAIRNRLSSVVLIASIGASRLKPFPTYQRWLTEWEPEHTEDFMKASDPKAIEEYDATVIAFNADMERIKKENDVAAIRTFVEKLLDISKGK